MNIQDIINEQFTFNKNKNIFSESSQTSFSNTTIASIKNIRKELLGVTPSELLALEENYTKQFELQFYTVNQYIYFSSEAKELIKGIFSAVIKDIKDTQLDIATIEKNHYQRIKDFIRFTNPLAYYMNQTDAVEAKSFVCKEYSPAFLMDLLQLNASTLSEPILDIGCGSQGYLVLELRSMGFEAYGFDRITHNETIAEGDWFTYPYGTQKWGTLISNLSFASHFLHHHLNNNDLANDYATTYMKILESLKTGGQWHYTPSLPFFEDLLPSKYLIKRTPLGKGFYKTTITAF